MKSLDELRKIRDEAKKDLEMRSGDHRAKIIVSMGTCGIAAGARETMKAFVDALGKHGLTDVAVTATGESGLVGREPVVEVDVKGASPVSYGNVDAEAARRIVAEHLVSGHPVEDFVFTKF